MVKSIEAIHKALQKLKDAPYQFLRVRFTRLILPVHGMCTKCVHDRKLRLHCPSEKSLLKVSLLFSTAPLCQRPRLYNVYTPCGPCGCVNKRWDAVSNDFSEGQFNLSYLSWIHLVHIRLTGSINSVNLTRRN